MRTLFVNRLPGWLRLAGTRDGLAETLSVFREDEPATGSIFLGRVTKLLPGIEAAFLDLGEAGSAFLNRRDLPRHVAPTRNAGLGSVLKEGRSLPVQIKVPAYADKHVQVTANLTLAGFSCILIPFGSGIRFSRNFKGDQSAFQQELLSDPAFSGSHGWMIRSAASETPVAQVAAEATRLRERFKAIESSAGTGSPRILHPVDPVMAFLLDRSGAEPLQAILVDDEATLERISDALQDHPPLKTLLKYHSEPTPMFDLYKLESEFQRALGRTVWLKSGGRIAIHQTPAMTVIDVDSGKNVKQKGRLSAAMRANLQAAEEACRQIRLRNLAGIIAVDFINVRDPDWRTDVNQALRRSLALDPVRTRLVEVNEIGLAHITRERRGPSLEESLKASCTVCRGTGLVERPGATAIRIQHQIVREAPGLAGESLVIRCSPGLAGYLEKRKARLFAQLESNYGIAISVRAQSSLPPEDFNIELAADISMERPDKRNGNRSDCPQKEA